jgi:ubiquinone biosynthesis protein UbiJ
MNAAGWPLAALESMCNRALRMDPEAIAAVEALAGKILALELTPASLTLYLIPGPGGLQLAGACPGEPDTRIRGTPLAFARLGLSHCVADGDVEISGDVALGRQLQAILGRLDLDWEELLARLTGDLLAHQVGNATRAAADWGRRSADALARDLSEYLHYEVGQVPPRREVEGFLDAVDRLRTDADRLETRVASLAVAHRGRTE